GNVQARWVEVGLAEHEVFQHSRVPQRGGAAAGGGLVPGPQQPGRVVVAEGAKVDHDRLISSVFAPSPSPLPHAMGERGGGGGPAGPGGPARAGRALDQILSPPGRTTQVTAVLALDGCVMVRVF